jgi:hypothetical protein
MPFITKRLKSFRSVTNHIDAKRQKRSASRMNHRSGSTGTHLMSVGKGDNPQGIAGHDSSQPEPAQCTILLPLPN